MARVEQLLDQLSIRNVRENRGLQHVYLEVLLICASDLIFGICATRILENMYVVQSAAEKDTERERERERERENECITKAE